MRQVWQARDGRVFSTPEQVQQYEDVLDEVREVRQSILPKRKDTVDFSNGHGYISLTSEQVRAFEENLLRLIKEHHSEKIYKVAQESLRGILGRYLDDGGSPLYGLWGLYMCIDPENRLWGQPYYALHPNEGEHIEL